MKISIVGTYSTNSIGSADISVGSWDEIDDWYVKWDTLHYHVKGTPEMEWKEAELHSDLTDGIDWKHPSFVEVYRCEENGDTDYDTSLAEKE